MGFALSKPIVGVIGSGLMGRDPFERKSWSTSSYFFFTGLQRRGVLSRAFGVEVQRLKRLGYIARNFRANREAWRWAFYNDVGYRDALTREIGRGLTETDYSQHSLLQIGAMYNIQQLAKGRASCFSYHDGNLAESLKSPYAPQGLGRRSTDRALAYERAVYHGMSRVFAMSEYLRQSFIRDFDVPAVNVVNVGAGVNLETMPELNPEKRYDTREVLFIGVDFPRKGGWELLKAFRAVRQRVPNATLHVVGPSNLAIPHEFEAGVVAHGYLSKNDPEGKRRLDELFRRCSLFVMPSIYEPFGIAPLEAMAHQLPCIVTDGWALREMVVAGVNGDLAACGNVDSLEDKLSALLHDPGALRRMGLAGREKVINEYTWDKVIDRLLIAIQAAELV